MVIPPPNVTGILHLGHALMAAIEDCICRWHRMHGKAVLWVPGADHSGIATQVVVEKKIAHEKKLTRHDLGRAKFLDEVYKYTEEKGDYIYNQFRLIGVSVDWDRKTYTLDSKCVKAVNETFIRLHEKGLIYRSNRLVNWSCALKSAISDIEVDKLDLTGRTMLSVPGYKEKVECGVLISFGYPVCDSDEKLIVATTRIETMLGDSAVAINPTDERYKHLHGKFVQHPFLDKRLPIVCDEYVEKDFGTGAVKITPAHDVNDYELGKRHNLPFINILSDDGLILPGFGAFSGLKRFHARKAIIEALKIKKLYVETKDHVMVIPICNRSKDIIEPMIKVQWYISCEEWAKKACEVVRNGELKFIPEVYNKIWFNWMENSRDWNISRQLWWGHRIPVYFVRSKDTIENEKLDALKDENRWVSASDDEEAKLKASKKFNLKLDNLILEQDEDVLDTWFSSGLFPFSVFGWPENTEDMIKYYPNNLLETGADIIFFWVARMVMMGMELTGKLPFKEVYLHSMVRDCHGRKMSKSLGNVIDPLYVIRGISLEDLHKSLYNSNLDPKEIEKAKAGQKADFQNGIPECGTDALRFGLLAYCLQGRDINLDIKRIEGYRFFCNKIWNAFKLTLMSLGDDFKPLDTERLTGNESKIDLWILSKIIVAAEQVNNTIAKYDFLQATTAVYHLWQYEFCDIYLEHLKSVLAIGDEQAKNAAKQTLYTCIDNNLRLLHPFMPFLTEELYQRLPRRGQYQVPSICVDRYPDVNKFTFKRDSIAEKEMSIVQDLVRRIRSIRSDLGLNKTKAELSLKYDLNKIDLQPYYNTIQVSILIN